MKYNKRSSLNKGAHHLTKAEDIDQSSSAKKVPFTSAVDNMMKTDVGDKVSLNKIIENKNQYV